MLYPAGGEVLPPADVGLQALQTVRLETPDGETLLAWHGLPSPGQPVVLFFQGNAGTLATRQNAFRQIIGAGYGLFAVSYRGYAGSTGSPSQAGLIADGLTAFDWLHERYDRIVIYGQSLGSGVATQVAGQRDAAALVLEVPFSAAVDVAAHSYPIFPVRLLMLDQWRSRDIIGEVGEPVLILEAAHDRIIPAGQAHRLFSAARQPKRHIVLDDVDHNTAWRGDLLRHLSAFVSEFATD